MIYKSFLLACAALLVSQTAPAQSNSDSDVSSSNQTQTTTSTTTSTVTTPPAGAAASVATAPVATAPGTVAPAHRKAHLSKMASRLITDTDQARQAIKNNDKDQALAEVNAALGLAGRIESASGTQTAMIPVYNELDEVSILGPVVAARRQQAGGQMQSYADRSQGSAGAGWNNQNNCCSNMQSSATATAAPGGEAVQDVTGQYTNVAVDVNMARQHLEAAKAALEQNNLQSADADLAAVQNGVVLTSVQSDMPLLKARQNLVLAKSLIQQGRQADAAVPLRAASDALQQYASLPSAGHVREAEQLRQSIDSSVSTVSQNTSGEIQNIDTWWNEISGWTGQQSRQSQQNQPASSYPQYQNPANGYPAAQPNQPSQYQPNQYQPQPNQ